MKALAAGEQAALTRPVVGAAKASTSVGGKVSLSAMEGGLGRASDEEEACRRRLKEGAAGAGVRRERLEA
eukprot:scaffold4818_cov39-Phaeocystis_antarctica.AAC.1